ncbi:SNARE complex subunit (Syn8) [Fusarium albosuccineum]|uniref:SNARE complex subunit (Syn8) n=1 Tax=Fusarium albosuccineum TaxID=1237068 RepID=A0A8H4LBR3_9HYPO|nr:SNARE complex subunit (Syn8) [Fusarium albosuccineum]
MSSANQLFLLADHVKLSLLERQRAKSLNLDGDSQDGHISRSLDQFRDGLANLREEEQRLTEAGDAPAASDLADSISNLQKQLDDLSTQFQGHPTSSTAATISHPNSEELADDFEHAASTSPSSRKPKTVRFSDTPSSPSAELFGPYRDDPSDSAGYQDEASGMSNQQIHEYHAQILEQQDEQLDRLGESIGRQRELSMQIGDELDSHVAMLDEVEDVTDRHQSRLDRASRVLGKVARGASENKQMTTIVVLIIILVLLIAILK